MICIKISYKMQEFLVFHFGVSFFKLLIFDVYGNFQIAKLGGKSLTSYPVIKENVASGNCKK